MAKKRKMRRKGEPKNPLPKVSKVTKHLYSRTAPRYDYFKYIRVIRYHIKRKYDLNWTELEFLLFIYSEGLFTRKDFKEFRQIYSWDKYAFDNMLQRGWIHKWRPHKGKQAALYEVTHKARQVINDFYEKCAYHQEIAESSKRNPIFSTGANFTDKVYRRAIRRFNAEARAEKKA
jgi:DNA-binding MarR family transcriptional regulator